MIKVLFIFGTRPEAIKLCPVIRHMNNRSDDFDVRVCVTAQHRELLDGVLDVFQVRPDQDLDIMCCNQTLFQSTSRIVSALESVLIQEQPDVVLVQGDTTTTFCGALASFYARIPVGHVEAGLRTGNLHQPFPEELNRLLTGRIASLHFAPTQQAAQNLQREGVDPTTIRVTGNTGIDAVLYVNENLESGKLVGLNGFHSNSSKKLILVTAHRRESFGAGFEGICRALARLARRDDIEIVYPVHPNPNVRGVVTRYLLDAPNITLLPPMDYVSFVDLIRRAYVLLTDSGGIQEEAPSLGKPVLVLRETTERPEAVTAGTARLVGTAEQSIIQEVERLIDDPNAYHRMARQHNPYGDGMASARIANTIVSGRSFDTQLPERTVQRAGGYEYSSKYQASNCGRMSG